MSSIRTLADENQSGELCVVIITEITTPNAAWLGLADLLQAVADNQPIFGPVIGDLSVRDELSPGGYARWVLDLPGSVKSIRNIPEDTLITPAEGALGTLPLVWLPPSLTHLEFEDMNDSLGIKSASLELQPVDNAVADAITGPEATSLRLYRIPQLPLRSPGKSSLSLHIFYDEETHELSLSIETWLDLWSPVCFDGTANEPWALVNRDWLQDRMRHIAQKVGGILDVVT